MGLFDFLNNRFLRGDERPGGGLFGYLQGARDTTVNIARSIPRESISLYNTIGKAEQTVRNKLDSAVGLQPRPEEDKTYQPKGIASAVLGDEPVETYQKRFYGPGGVKSHIEESRFRGQAGVLTPLLAGLTIGSNFIPGGKGAKQGTEALVKNIIKTKTATEVKKIIPGIADDIARKLAKATDPYAIKNILTPTAPKSIGGLPTKITSQADEAAARAQAAIPPPGDVIPPPSPEPTSYTQKAVEALRGQAAAPGQSPVTGISKLQAQQKALTSQGRKAQVARAEAASQGLTGEAALTARRQAYGGELPKVNTDKLVDNVQSVIDHPTYEGVLNELLTSPNLQPFDQTTAGEAWKDFYTKGRMIQPAELEKIERAAPGLANAVVDTANTFKSRNSFVNILGLSKGLKSMADLGGMFRQGLFLGPRFGKEFGNAFAKSIKFFGNKQAYDEAIEAIPKMATDAGTPLKDLMLKADLDVLGIKKFREEAFPTDIIEKYVPLGARSGRAFEGGLSVQRADVFAHIMNDLEKAGRDITELGTKEVKSLGDFINTASGRADLGSLGKFAPTVREALFSARLWKSRLNLLNPVYYAKLDPIARKYALQSAGAFAGLAGTVLTLAKMSGAEVETDARSSDFLKIKVGDTRYDILGGFQQNLVFAWRQIAGEKKSSTSGAITKFAPSLVDYGKEVLTGGKHEPGVDTGPFTGNRLTILSDLIKNKESPALSTALDIYAGEKHGQPVNTLSEAGKLVVPLSFEGGYEAIKNRGFNPLSIEGIKEAIKSPGSAARALGEGVGLNAPNFAGIGTQTYGLKETALSKSQQEQIGLMKKAGASPEVIGGSKLFFQTLKQVTPLEQNVRDKAKEALDRGDTNKATNLVVKYNEQLTKALQEWAEQYPQLASHSYFGNLYNKAQIKTLGN